MTLTLAQQARTESEIQAEIVEYLEAAGWYVRVFSQDVKTRRQVAGWLDVVGFRRGITLLIQCKTTTGRLRDKQIEFAEAIAPHLWSTLLYVVARDVSDVAALFGDRVI